MDPTRHDPEGLREKRARGLPSGTRLSDTRVPGRGDGWTCEEEEVYPESSEEPLKGSFAEERGGGVFAWIYPFHWRIAASQPPAGSCRQQRDSALRVSVCASPACGALPP